MLFLSEIQGPFAVGATTFVTPVQPSRIISAAKLKTRDSTSQLPAEPALCLREVAFTAYYPAKISSETPNKGIPWLIRPIKESLHGFARFLSLPSWLLWPIVYLYGALIKIPVYPNAPLLSPRAPYSSDSEQNPRIDQWPVVIFSHGLGGSRTAYSHFCSRLAASGKVVLAMEHRDGTATACTPRLWESDRKIHTRPVHYYRDDDVTWEDSKLIDDNSERLFPLRADQLAFRQQEIYIAFKMFSQFLHSGLTPLEMEVIDGAEIDKQSWSPILGRDVCCTDNLTLAGHSFGGCTVLSVLSTRPPPGHASMPITNALVLDPWVDPLSSPGPFPGSPDLSSAEFITSVTSSLDLDNSGIHTRADDPSLPRILVLNSETFTLWKDHYERLQSIIRHWEPHGQRIITLVGSEHTSFSDTSILPLLPRRGAGSNLKLLDVISKLSIAFLDGCLQQELEFIPRRNMEAVIVGNKKNRYGKPKRKLVGSVGEIIVM